MLTRRAVSQGVVAAIDATEADGRHGGAAGVVAPSNVSDVARAPPRLRAAPESPQDDSTLRGAGAHVGVRGGGCATRRRWGDRGLGGRERSVPSISLKKQMTLRFHFSSPTFTKRPPHLPTPRHENAARTASTSRARLRGSTATWRRASAGSTTAD